MTDSYSKLRELMNFPCVVEFRVIVDSTVVNSIEAIKEAVNEIDNGAMQEIKEPPRKSSKGNYVSYTIPVKVADADKLKSFYEKIGALSCVKHII